MCGRGSLRQFLTRVYHVMLNYIKEEMYLLYSSLMSMPTRHKVKVNIHCRDENYFT